MGQKCVIYNSDTPLPCGCCLPAPVVLCIPAYKVAPHLCPDGVTEQPFEWNHIEGSIGDSKRISTGCGAALVYRYTICFDEEQIAEGQVLETGDISGVVCQGCLVQYVKDVVGNEPFFTDNEDGTITFTSPHGCEFTFLAEVPVSVESYRNINLNNVGAVVKAAPGSLSGWYMFNQSAVTLYVKFYDKATLPLAADTPKLTIPLPPNDSGTNIDWSKLPDFDLGIGVRATTGIADADDVAPGANEVVVNIFFE